MRFERRWFRCEADCLGCNPVFPEVKTPTCTLTAGDLGKRLAVEVKAIGADPENVDRTATLLSAPSEVVADAPAIGGGGGDGGGEQQGGATQVPPPPSRSPHPRS